MFKYHIILLLLLLPIILPAQDSLHVSVLTHVKAHSIQLRWGVNSPMAWKHTNKFGYRIERYTIVRNDQVLERPEKQVLEEILKPAPLDSWETLGTTNTFAAIIAQALYGESFQLTGAENSGYMKWINLAQELEQRYLISMFAADMFFPAAKLAGWGYEDHTVKAGERYLYRITPLVPEDLMAIKAGAAYVTLSDYEPLPQPQEFTGIYGDRSVLLTWNYGILRNTYNAYYIEKSVDSIHYTRLSETPHTNINTRDGKPANRMYYMDTLAMNNQKTYYRIIGVNAFGEEGPPSETVSGTGIEKLEYVPHIRKAIPDPQGGVHVTWEFDEKGNTMISHFELHRGDTHQGPFLPVIDNIATIQREVTYDKLQASNYFVIAAIPHEGDPVYSFPVLVQPIDSIPPAIPQGLSGTIDTLGVVTLTWNANTDKDILGYRLYRAHTETEELVPITDIAIRDTHFTDTVEVYNLNSQVYYALTALDQRYNQSSQAPKIAVQKPDVVPPSPPLITSYRVTPEGIQLEWETGGEENIAVLQLYRQEAGHSENLIQTIKDPDTKTYTDITTSADRTYAYRITSVTSSGLSSKPSPTFTVQAMRRAEEPMAVNSFEAKKNKKNKILVLHWSHQLLGVAAFELYKSEAENPMRLWKTVKGYDTETEDREVSAGLHYEYMIRPVFENGKNGKVKKVEVKY